VPAHKLEVRGISKAYRQAGKQPIPVLADLSFTVADLEFVAVIGPSGCGKSTFLRIVVVLINQNSGSVLLDGAEVTGPG